MNIDEADIIVIRQTVAEIRSLRFMQAVAISSMQLSGKPYAACSAYMTKLSCLQEHLDRLCKEWDAEVLLNTMRESRALEGSQVIE